MSVRLSVCLSRARTRMLSLLLARALSLTHTLSDTHTIEIARIQGLPYVPHEAQQIPQSGLVSGSSYVSSATAASRSSYVSSATAASRSSSAAAALRSDLSRRLPPGDETGGGKGESSGMYSTSSATGGEEAALTSQSESQTEISFGIAAGLQSQSAASATSVTSATATSVTSAASSALASTATRSVSSAGRSGRRMQGRDGGEGEGGHTAQDDAPEPGEAAGKMKKGLFKRLNPFAKAP